ncbi:DUF551 domain-containing protein [Escherichia coli]|uniref:DUF551 domain-containing protein n=1 Tax=Escherichia coli TaxID=562 RepID=UPI0030132662
MSAITKQWLNQKIADMEAARDEIPFGLDEDDSNTLAALRIALESLEAEAVCVIDQSNLDYLKSGSDADVWPASRTEMGDVLLYRSATPAPVSVPAAMEMDDDFDSAFEHGKAVGWNACRAAMLQAEHVSNSDELPLDYLQGHKDGLEWAAQLAEANHPQTGDWLYDDPIDLARAIRKGPDMPTVQGGNSPVTPDGWISCSERMPDKLIPVIVMYEDGEMWSAMWNGNRWDDGTEYPDPHSVTHWREMPAAPQQEVNRG